MTYYHAMMQCLSLSSDSQNLKKKVIQTTVDIICLYGTDFTSLTFLASGPLPPLGSSERRKKRGPESKERAQSSV
jgi:hypothetical protein